MIGVEIQDGFIDFANILFKCPFCSQGYLDIDDKYLDKCNKNKSGFTKIRCRCGKKFGMTYDYMSNAVGFGLEGSII